MCVAAGVGNLPCFFTFYFYDPYTFLHFNNTQKLPIHSETEKLLQYI